MKHALALAAALFATSAAAAPASLCEEGEEVRYTCVLAGTAKFISVCSSPQLSATAGYLQYRAGEPGKIEMEFPAERKKSQEQFRWISQTPYKSLIEALVFTREGLVYTIYKSELGPEVSQKPGGLWTYGLRIAKNTPPKFKKDLLCAEAPTGNFEFRNVVPDLRE